MHVGSPLLGAADPEPERARTNTVHNLGRCLVLQDADELLQGGMIPEPSRLGVGQYVGYELRSRLRLGVSIRTFRSSRSIR